MTLSDIHFDNFTERPFHHLAPSPELFRGHAAGSIEIFTLGRFLVRRNGQVISLEKPRSRKMWCLFQYLLSQRGRNVKQKTLTDLLWPGQDSTDSGHALRTLIYRLRRTLEGDDRSAGEAPYILSSYGCYAFNPDTLYWLDVEQFEILCQKAFYLAAGGNEQAAVAVCREALALYRGDYLQELSEGWVVPFRNHYRTIYTRCVQELTRRVKHRNGRENMTPDPALLTENLKDTPGGLPVPPLDSPAGLPADVVLLPLQSEKDLSNLQQDLFQVRQNLLGRDNTKDAFNCDPETFRVIFQLEMRRLERNNNPSFICCLYFKRPPLQRLGAALDFLPMRRLQKILLENLHQGDAMCRWNQTFYMVLLAGKTRPEAEMLIQNMKDIYSRESGSKVPVPHSYLLPLQDAPAALKD